MELCRSVDSKTGRDDRFREAPLPANKLLSREGLRAQM